MGLVEALALLLIGLFSGVFATIFDVFALGAGSFLSHFTLWVLLNALLAVHVESRLRAILWAIPFNLGYIEGYFITTVASFEGYAKSLMMPLAAVALISPFLVYALWTAKKEQNAYGKVLSVLIVAGTLAASYFVKGKLGVYDFVVCALLALVLFVMPVRRLRISRSTRESVPTYEGEFDQEDLQERASTVAQQPNNGASDTTKRTNQAPTRRIETEESSSPYAEPQKRSSFLKRRAQRKQEAQERKERLRATEAARRRKRNEPAPESTAPATLGNVRPARRRTRTTATDAK